MANAKVTPYDVPLSASTIQDFIRQPRTGRDDRQEENERREDVPQRASSGHCQSWLTPSSTDDPARQGHHSEAATLSQTVPVATEDSSLIPNKMVTIESTIHLRYRKLT